MYTQLKQNPYSPNPPDEHRISVSSLAKPIGSFHSGNEASVSPMDDSVPFEVLRVSSKA